MYNVITIALVNVSGQEFQPNPYDGERDKRALDLGLVLRNLLMKSAYASNTKAAVSRNLLNAKLAKTTTTTTTTTPRPTRPPPAPITLPPFFVNKKSFFFPFSASSGAFQPINKFNNVQGNAAAVAGGGGVGGTGVRGGLRGGYMNFDYDYMDQQRLVAPARRRRPSTTAAPTTTTTQAPPPPPPPAPLPPRRQPLGAFGGRSKFLNYDYYDDYDYPAEEPTTAAPPPPPPPSRRARPRQRRPTAANQANGPAPAAPGRTGARQDRPPRLRNPLIYQYAQPNGKIAQLVTNCRNIGFSPSLCRYLYQ